MPDTPETLAEKDYAVGITRNFVDKLSKTDHANLWRRAAEIVAPIDRQLSILLGVGEAKEEAPRESEGSRNEEEEAGREVSSALGELEAYCRTKKESK